MTDKGTNPFSNILSEIQVEEKHYKYFDLTKLNDSQYDRLPFSIRVLLESAIRNCDNFQVSSEDVSKILEWEKNQTIPSGVEVPFKPARVILQDFTGVPAVVDFAAMRDSIKELGGDPAKINPICPSDLVIDHSVQVDFSRSQVTFWMFFFNLLMMYVMGNAHNFTFNNDLPINQKASIQKKTQN